MCPQFFETLKSRAWQDSLPLYCCSLLPILGSVHCSVLMFTQQTFYLSAGQPQLSLLSPTPRTHLVITVAGQIWGNMRQFGTMGHMLRGSVTCWKRSHDMLAPIPALFQAARSLQAIASI